MPRTANPFYYNNDQAFGAQLGASLGKALFGDPEAAAALALRKAQMENYAANAEESRAHAGLYTKQGEGVDIQNGASRSLPDLMRSLLPAAAFPQPAPADPLAPLPDGPVASFDPQTFQAGLPALFAAMGQMQGDRINPNGMVGGLSAMLGNDEFARRGLVAQGHTPGKDFAITPERADQISARDADEAFHQATTIEDVRSGDRRYTADRSLDGRRYAADRSLDGKVYASDAKGQAGFSVVSDVLPGAVMTGGERSRERNAEVGGVGNSHHLPGDGWDAYDVRVGTGARNFADAKAAMIAKYGAGNVEAVDESRSTKGTGPHWHFAVRRAAAGGGKNAKADKPKSLSNPQQKALTEEVDAQLKRTVRNRETSGYQQARDMIRERAISNFQRTGNVVEAARDAVDWAVKTQKKNVEGRTKAEPKAAANKSGGDDLRRQALAAIGRGKDPAAVRAKYKQLTGEDL